MKSIFKRILKVIITSFLICFFSGVVLMIANKIMGVEGIGIICYLLLGGLCFVMLSVCHPTVEADAADAYAVTVIIASDIIQRHIPLFL